MFRNARFSAVGYNVVLESSMAQSLQLSDTEGKIDEGDHAAQSDYTEIVHRNFTCAVA